MYLTIPHIRRREQVEVGDDVVPDDTTILRFRHMLDEDGLTQQILDEIADLLAHQRLLLGWGTIVDTTIIAELDQERDPNPRS
jgi:transposase, IS5 family